MAKVGDKNTVDKLTQILKNRSYYDATIIRHIIRGLHNSSFGQSVQGIITEAMQAFVGVGSLEKGNMSGGLSGRPEQFSYKYIIKTIEEDKSESSVNEALSVLTQLARTNDKRAIDYFMNGAKTNIHGLQRYSIITLCQLNVAEALITIDEILNDQNAYIKDFTLIELGKNLSIYNRDIFRRGFEQAAPNTKIDAMQAVGREGISTYHIENLTFLLRTVRATTDKHIIVQRLYEINTPETDEIIVGWLKENHNAD